MIHHHKSEILQTIEFKLNEIISASDQFETSRIKLVADLNSFTDLELLKEAVKTTFDERSNASTKHMELANYLIDNKHHFSPRERAEMDIISG